MAEFQIGTIEATLTILLNKGVRYSTVIDLGCADGFFFVQIASFGLAPDCVPLNIDANPIYESTLREIKDVFGGDYLIAAMSDAPGETMFTNAIHPYWSSLRPSNDPYWYRINNMAAGAETVRALHLDDVVAELNAKPPFLLKLDIQGSEAQALRGARRILEQTSVVICEADIDDFRGIDTELAASGLDLFDLTALDCARDKTIGWFYPVYLNRRLSHLRERHIWNEADNQAVVKIQEDRRRSIQAWYADILPKIKASKERKS